MYVHRIGTTDTLYHRPGNLLDLTPWCGKGGIWREAVGVVPAIDECCATCETIQEEIYRQVNLYE